LDCGLLSSSPGLLFRLSVTTTGANAPQIGDSFTISLIPSSGPAGIAFTEFVDLNGNVLPFRSTSGSVIIIAANTEVPEPSGIALAGLMLALGACHSAVARLRNRYSPHC
jgi:hypothetical protein